jgi:CheY-like chemotaxis protein
MMLSPNRSLVTILMTEDDETSAPLIIEQLKEKGYGMRWCLNGACCLDTLEGEKGGKPDILILDLRLPDMRGEEVLEHLIHQPVSQKLRIIVISAHLARGEEKAFLNTLTATAQTMVSSVLVKPFDMLRLDRAIEKAVAEMS